MNGTNVFFGNVVGVYDNDDDDRSIDQQKRIENVINVN